MSICTQESKYEAGLCGENRQVPWNAGHRGFVSAEGKRFLILKIRKTIYDLKFKKLLTSLQSCVSLSLLRFLGRILVSILFPIYIYPFPKLETETTPPNGDHRRKRAINSLPRLRSPSKFHVDHWRNLRLPIRLFHSSRLYTEKELRAAKLCKHLLRELSDEAKLTSYVAEAVGKSLSRPAIGLGINLLSLGPSQR